MSGIKALQRPVGGLTKLYHVPCSVPPSLWLETSIPAIVNAVWTVLSPDLKEAYHIAVGQSLVCSLKSEIREATELGGGELGEATRFLFRAAEWADLAVWWLFLASVGADGFLDWTSMAYELAGCTGPSGAQDSDNPQGGTTDNTDIENANGFSWLTNDPFKPAFAMNVFVEPNQSYGLFWSCSGQDVAGNRIPMTVITYELGTGIIIDNYQTQRGKDGKIPPAIAMARGRNNPNEAQIIGVLAWGNEATSHHEVFPLKPAAAHCFPAG